MLVDVVTVTPLDGYLLRLKFDDGLEGDFDFSGHVGFDGIFALLRDPEYFRRVGVNPDIGTIAWPNGADLDPVVLHQAVQQKGQSDPGCSSSYPT